MLGFDVGFLLMRELFALFANTDWFDWNKGFGHWVNEQKVCLDQSRTKVWGSLEANVLKHFFLEKYVLI
jgi:hypothetical protein